MGFAAYYENSSKLNNLIRERYWQIRNDRFSISELENSIDNYRKLLVDSGAIFRDAKRWNVEVRIDEFDNIKDWIHKRIEFLDDFYKYVD